MTSSAFKGSDAYNGEDQSGSIGDGKVLVNSTDLIKGFLDSKIVAGSNINFYEYLDPTLGIIIRIDGFGSAGIRSKRASFDRMIGQYVGQIRQDGSITTGRSDGTRAWEYVAPYQMTIASMAMFFRQVGGQPWRFVIYDENGNLIGVTSRFTPVTGWYEVNFSMPIDVAIDRLIYLGYWSGDAGGNTTVELMGNCLIDSTSPLIQVSDINEAPFTIGSGLTQTAFRPWFEFGT